MRKLEIADPEVMRIAIQQEIARSVRYRETARLRGGIEAHCGFCRVNG
ncbi:hypothetical protein [Georgfuchsia toluolica]|nr:hypothetical protein [Georgfuchsia toluolica]